MTFFSQSLFVFNWTTFHVFFTFKIAPVNFNCVSIHVSKFNGSIDNRGGGGGNRRNSYLNRNKNIRRNIKHEILIGKKTFRKARGNYEEVWNIPAFGFLDSFLERIANRSVGIFYYPIIFVNSFQNIHEFDRKRSFSRWKNFARVDSFLLKSRKISEQVRN